jgi:hypothetical protein
MTGILLILASGIWLAIVIGLSASTTRALPATSWRLLVGILVFAALLPLPLFDEIVGRVQFSELCKQHDLIRADREKVKGTTVYFEPVDAVHIQTLWIPVRLQSWRYVAAGTGEVVIGYETLHATGGWLIRTLRISEGDVPLTFKDSCYPREDVRKFSTGLQITALDKPSAGQKGN